MRALAPGGVLSVTLWNKEEPPKSVLKLYATMAAAGARSRSGRSRRFVLRRLLLPLDRDGAVQARRLHADEIAKLRKHTRDMSFDEIYSPGFSFDASQTDATLDGYVAADFRRRGRRSPRLGERRRGAATAPPTIDARAAVRQGRRQRLARHRDGRLAWHTLIAGDWPDIAKRYVFDTRALTNDAPYFAAYVKTGDLPARHSTGSNSCRTSGAIC